MTDKKQIKILLVDDDKFLLDMYVLKFKSKEIDADTASGSMEALEKLRNRATYDIILLDIIMPSMSGMELLKTINEEKLIKNSIVVMLTNQSDEAEKAKELGAKGYIIKATTIPSEVVDKVLEIYEHNKK